ncbi:MAG: hypothetical protein ABL897_06500 [Hyphomicrobium sp.]
MIFEIAVGTAIGILCAAILGLLAYRWYRLANSADGWPRAKRYGIGVLIGLLAGVTIWLAIPEVKRQLADRQQKIASIQKAEHDRLYCQQNKVHLVAEASKANVEPRDSLGLNRSLSDFRSVQSPGFFGMLETRTELSAFGWLRTCKTLGLVTDDELKRVTDEYRANQNAHDVPELAKKKALLDALR